MTAFSSLAAVERAAALNPKTKPHELLRLAAQWPEEVLCNPVLPMVLLSDPVGGVRLQDTARQSRAERDIARFCMRATLRTRRAWLVTCISRVLPRFEALHPEDKRPRYTLELVLNAGRQRIPQYAWQSSVRARGQHTEHPGCLRTMYAVSLACSKDLGLQMQSAVMASEVSTDPISEREWQANDLANRVRHQRGQT